LIDALRALVGRRLEQGAAGAWPARLAASAWEIWSARHAARPLRLPTGVRLIGVGGAVLGGAGKTPVAIALTRALALRGERPALIGHAYRAHTGRARVVRPDDPVALVGDDALTAAWQLGDAVAVVVAPTRQAALDHAAALGHRVILADGLLQTAPRRLTSALLVLDALAPWGAGACPPLGDLRAPRASLLQAADFVVAVQPEGTDPDPALPAGAVVVPSRVGGAISRAGEVVSLDGLRGQRLGLMLAVARPARVVAALAREGIRPEVQVLLGDHAVPTASLLAQAGRASVDVWLTTARCGTKLPDAIGGRPVLALDHRVDVGELVRRLASEAGD
jgi:tetraacyldisaccharide 4'-kinase